MKARKMGFLFMLAISALRQPNLLAADFVVGLRFCVRLRLRVVTETALSPWLAQTV